MVLLNIKSQKFTKNYGLFRLTNNRYVPLNICKTPPTKLRSGVVDSTSVGNLGLTGETILFLFVIHVFRKRLGIKRDYLAFRAKVSNHACCRRKLIISIVISKTALVDFFSRSLIVNLQNSFTAVAKNIKNHNFLMTLDQKYSTNHGYVLYSMEICK